MAVQELEQHPELREFWFSRLLVKRPLVVLFSAIGFCLVLIGIVAGARVFELSENSDRDFYVEDDIRVERWDSVVLAQDNILSLAGKGEQVTPNSQQYNGFTLFVVYKSKKDLELLTSKNLEAMKKVEDRILGHWRYSSLCLKDFDSDGTTCSDEAYRSLLSLFTFESDGTISQTTIDTTVDTERANPNSTIYNFLDSDFQNTQPDATFARTTFLFGLPLPDDGTGKPYEDEDDRTDEQVEFYIKFIDTFNTYATQDVPSDYDTIEVYLAGEEFFNILFEKAILGDFMWAVGSIMFVWFYMAVHTRSLFLSSMGMLGILLAFPVAYFVYRIFFQIEYFQTLQMLAIFVLLGIAADDIFVFVDAWEQAAIIHPALEEDIGTRMAFTYRRAAKAMFATTLTTCGAFVATAFSQIMPIAAFGIWAAVLIAMNYMLIITYFASVVMIYHRYIRYNPYCLGKSTEPKLVNEDLEMIRLEAASNVLQNTANSSQSDQEPEFRRVEKYFIHVHSPFFNKYRYIFIGIFSAWLIVSLVFAFQISPLSEPEQFFPDGHRYSKTLDYMSEPFNQEDDDLSTVVYHVWGLSGVDRSGSSRWDAEDYGKAVYDKNFDPSSADAQEYLVTYCEDLGNFKHTFSDSDGPVVSCFINDFKDYAISEGFGFPVDSGIFSDLLFNWSLLEESGQVYISSKEIGWNEDTARLDYVLFAATTSLDFQNTYTQKKPVYDDFEDFVNDHNDVAPSGINNAFQCTEAAWQWMISERAFIKSAIQGMSIAMALAFVTLLFSTMNYIVAIIATISIVGILSSVVAILVFNGNELGVSESIAMVILIGFSVDYVVHLGNAYIESKSETRFGKMQDSLRDMGISVVAGALTTLGAGSFLWPAVVVFFYKFAFIITFTVIFATLWSMVFFVSMMFAFGPEKESGSIRVLYAKIHEKLIKSDE